MEKNNTRILYGIIAMFVILLGVYSNDMLYANAVSTVNATFTAGTTTQDVTYSSATGSDTHTAYVIGTNAGQAYAWKTSASPLTTYNILFNVTLTGSASARAIEWNDDTLFIYAVTNDKVYKLSQDLGIAGSLASGTANIIQELYYDTDNEVLYYCTNDGYGSINVSTLALTALYTDGAVNSVFGCDFDILNSRAVLVGDNIGVTNCELITVSLISHTQIGCVNTGGAPGADPFYGVCVDGQTGASNYWALRSSSTSVKKYDFSLTLEATVTVGTTPRNCSINNDDTGRRLYVANEGSDTISILDIDANVVLTSPVVCDTVADRKLATHRTSNTTHTFVTCNSNVNSVIIDNTVSEFVPTFDENDTSCANPANSALLRCVLSDGQDLTGIGGVVGEGVTDLACNVIFTDCTDPDPATNGIGLLIFIASIFVVVGM